MTTPANVSFHRLTRSQFSSLSTKTDGSLYFITDENVILMQQGDASVEYTGRIKFIASNADFPSTGLADCLYIKGTTGKIYSGSAWVSVFPPPDPVNTVSSSNTTQAVTGKAVADYISGLYAGNTGDAQDQNKIPLLGANGKLNDNVIPAYALSSFMGTKSSVSALSDYTTAQEGDWAKVENTTTPSESGSYIKTASGWERLADKLDEITVDTTWDPTSTNPATSAAINGAIQAAITGGALTWIEPSAS